MHLANNLFFLICPFFVIGLSFQAQNDYDLSKFIDQMEILSRLTNGIILEAGLIDESISPDDVISEILHLGAQKVDKLLEIDRVKLLDVITKYQNLSQSLSISSEIKAVEERFHLFENITTEINFEDLSKLDGESEYEDGVKQLEKLNTDMGVVENLFSNLTAIEERIENARNIDISNLTSSELNAELDAIKSMIGEIEEFSKNVTEFNNFVTEIGKISDFEKVNISFLDQLKFEKELRDRYDLKIKNGTKIQLDVIKENVEHFHESSQFFNVSHNLIIPILEFISSRIDDQKWAEKFTSKFSRHPSDIQDLPDDAKNDELKLLFNKKESDWVSEHLSKSLVPLADFGKILTEFDARWKILSLKTSLDDLSFVNDVQIKLAKNFELKNIQLEKLKSFEECDLHPNASVQTLEKIEEIRNAKNELKEAYSKLSSMFDYLKNLPDLKTLRNFKKLGKKHADSLKLNKEINETLGLIRTLKEDLPDFKEKMQNISELIKKVNSTPINEYLNSLEDSGYLGFYSCLKTEIGNEGKVVVDLLNEIDEIRKRGLENTTRSQEASGIVNAFVSSLDGLKNLRTYGEEMKNVTEMEVIALKSSIFNNSLIIMKKIQKSVEGLTHIRKLSEKRTELGAIFGDSDFIKTVAEKEKDKLKIEEYHELLKFENLKTSLETILSKIDKLNESIGSLEAANFSSFIPIFQEANEIEDFKQDVELMITALNSLKNVGLTTQQNITALVDALDVLKSLNLKFSTFEILSGIEGLRSLDAFFSSFSGAIPPPSTVPPPSTTEVILTETTTTQSTQVDIAMKQTGNTTASTMPEWQIGLIVAICLILAAAIIFGILCYCRRWFCFKNRKGKSASSPNKDNFIEIFPPPVPAVPAEESLYIPPTSTYQPLSTLPPAPSKTEQPKKETSSDGTSAQAGGQEFPPAEITVEPTQETEAKTKTVEEGPAETKSKEGTTGSKESVSKGSKSKEENKMKPSQEAM
ncbi:hypothetical protein GCK72_010217 [Caenorhabditis remanei]|uniref:Domain of unknown function WSN domain-containing protein n=1 Tax=Caenorhabditis remanei TaxID=31234 RepID=A0A6A5H2P1_CAERE|nr:hypothetical protein GCK72_010217 [Caenorhabditis remanei]KAF1761958.1 hypothetical protein GCK72_010217 [Caenorhabditis remanei]